MNETEQNNIVTEPAQAVKELPSYSLKESIFALLFSLSGYIFCKTAFISGGIAGAIFLLVLCGASMTFAVMSKAKQSKYSYIYFIGAVVFFLNTGISGNLMVQFLDALFGIILYAMWAFTVNNPSYRGAEDNLVYCLLSSVFGQTFINFGKCPSAIISLTRKNSAGQNIRNAVIGLFIAAPVTLIVISLLSSADDNFSSLMGKLFDGIIDNFLGDVVLFFFSLPLSFLIFGLVFAAVKNTKENRLDAERCSGITKSLRLAPAVIMYSSVIPLCIVYVIFFFSQLAYFTSAFSGILPEEFSAAEYARQGFFELCGVAVINLAVIVAINILCRFEEKRPAPLKFFTSLMSVFTLILIATAFSKMAMYIERFGLTQLRVYTSWFMILLAVLFLLVIVRQFRKINLAKIGSVIFTVMLAGLSFAQTDALITKYNLEMFRSGTLDETVIDMHDFSADAIFTAIEMFENGNAIEKEEALDFIRRTVRRSGDYDPHRNSVTDFIAIDVMEKYGISMKKTEN